MDLAALLDRITDDVAPEVGRGAVADYIPALARVRPGFGIAVADVDGAVHGAGDWLRPFSVQSMSKVFTLALVLARGDDVWTRVGREPSGDPFNSLVQLEHEDGIPRNPFINAGALVVTDELTCHGDAVGALLGFLRAESGHADIDVDAEVAASEAGHADRNRALAYFMASYGNMRNPVPSVLDQYVRQCSIAMSCRDVARSALFLARHGVRNDGTRLLGLSSAKRINAVMLTCGTYDAAGEFAYRVGLPGKSGVGGGIVAIVPGRCAVCVWSPGLDARGNSVAGVAALDRFTTLTGWSVF
ncbi:glutaminase [Amycolatopsis sp. WQ 127309]|uniref:glutaminase n=1 Tax=Amycolatopsis sp. WQ 127309 TaxID=2932773 RepID=UPI001FF0F005|nr:glutaminase [Amycolatopsis sp. WQ 127309]UOZ04217.1 glutaminase [Amycolatopsis sp. WQ 127309]